jgi:hypothetical protein
MTDGEAECPPPVGGRLGGVVAAKGQLSCDLAGEAVILDLNSGVYFGLNEVGARVWNLVQEPRSVREIRETILREYDVEPGRWEVDLQALLRELAEAGLVEVRDETAG